MEQLAVVNLTEEGSSRETVLFETLDVGEEKLYVSWGDGRWRRATPQSVPAWLCSCICISCGSYHYVSVSATAVILVCLWCGWAFLYFPFKCEWSPGLIVARERWPYLCKITNTQPSNLGAGSQDSSGDFSSTPAVWLNFCVKTQKTWWQMGASGLRIHSDPLRCFLVWFFWFFFVLFVYI